MSEFGFTRVPDDVYDALEKGHINPTQFTILALLHRWAGYTTAKVQSFSAERVLRFLGIERPPDDAPEEKMDRYQAHRRGMQKQIRALRLAGWFHWDYEEGSKRPYNVWLHNYVVDDGGHISAKSPSSPGSEWDRDAEEPWEGHGLYPCSIKPCRPLRDLSLEEGDAEEKEPVSLKRIEISPNNQCTVKDEQPNGNAARALMRQLASASATELNRTRVVPSNLREKFDLIETAYGSETVRADFLAFCRELKAKGPNVKIPKMPIIEYLKVIDARLGKMQPPPDINDPRIGEFAGLVYDETGFLPSVHSIARLMEKFDLQEIVGAFKEYAGTLASKDYKTAMKTFFTESGASAVIFARRRRKEPGAAQVSAQPQPAAVL